MSLLNLKDVKLLSKTAALDSIDEVDLSVVALNKRYRSQIFPATDFVSKEFAKELDANGFLYFMPCGGIDPESGWTRTSDFIHYANKEKFESVNVEVDLSNESLADLEWALAANKKVDFIFLSSLRLNSLNGLERTLWIANRFVNSKLIVGNLCTHDAVEKFSKAGAVGIGVGRPEFGSRAFSIPMFSALRSLYLNTHPRPHVFLCNEITHEEDIGVALTAGADFVCVEARSIARMAEIEFSLKKQVYLCGAKSALSLSPAEQEYIIINE